MKAILIAAALAAAAVASAATLDFDDAEALLADNSNAATASVLDARYPAVGLAYYRFIDPNDPNNSDPYVPVTAVSYVDYPNLAPGSGANALDGFLGTLVVDFAVPSSSFAIDVVGNVGSTGGNVGNPFGAAQFFDAAGNLLDTVAMDTTQPGRFAYLAQPFSRVVLPNSTYYDNLTFAPVPEPASLAALALGAGLVVRRRRR